MNYGRIPLFPGGCSDGGLRVPLFDDSCRCESRYRSCDASCQTVRIYNPACSGEYADVELCVDSCGNLSICVHRTPKDCCSRERRRRCR